MSALKSARQEQLARLLAGNVPVQEAFATAGYKADSGNAFRLARSAAVVERVSQLQAEAMNAQGVSAEMIVAAAAAVALGEIDVSSIDPEHLTPEQRRAASSFEITVDSKGKRVTRVRFEKAPFLTLLGRWRGMEREERPDLRDYVVVESPLAMLQARIEELARRNADADMKTIEHISVSN